MRFEQYLVRLLHGVHIAHRPMTLGVRGALFDAEGRVFLVRHTYVSGWYLPGGGVDPGETAAAALKREIVEEGGLELADEPELVSVHFNRAAANRDHVLFYRCGGFRRLHARKADMEIAETGFFDPGDLPASATPATRRRLRELGTNGPFDPDW